MAGPQASRSCRRQTSKKLACNDGELSSGGEQGRKVKAATALEDNGLRGVYAMLKSAAAECMDGRATVEAVDEARWSCGGQCSLARPFAFDFPGARTRVSRGK